MSDMGDYQDFMGSAGRGASAAVAEGRQKNESNGLGLLGDAIGAATGFIAGTVMSGGNPVVGAIAAGGSILKKVAPKAAGPLVDAATSLATRGAGSSGGSGIDTGEYDGGVDPNAWEAP